MNSWTSALQSALEGRGQEVEPAGFLALLAISALSAFVVARLYVQFYGRRASGSDVHRAFPLLGIAITAIFVCLQFSLPLSLGLLGALSIVRFRTPIKEPEEIGFLMVIIATSLACATGRLAYVALILVATVLGLLGQQLARPMFRNRRESGVIILSFPQETRDEARDALFGLLAGAARRGSLDSLTTHDGRVTVTWRFVGLPAAEAPALERRLAETVPADSLSIVYSAGSD